MFIHYSKYTRIPDRRSRKILTLNIHVCLFKCFEPKYVSMFLGNSRTTWRRHYCEVNTLNDKQFAVLLKAINAIKQHHHTICIKQKMATSDEHAGRQTAGSTILYSIRNDAYQQMKSTEIYKHVPRAVIFKWKGRFRNGSTENTSRGRSQYLLLIAKHWNPCRTSTTVTGDELFEKLLRWCK